MRFQGGSIEPPIFFMYPIDLVNEFGYAHVCGSKAKLLSDVTLSLTPLEVSS